MSTKAASLFDRAILRQAAIDAVKKLDPRAQLRNPVMFVTLVGALLTFEQLFTSHEPFGYVLQIALWLLFTVLFANFAEAVAEGRGKAQADTLKRARTQTAGRRLRDGREEKVSASDLRRGDLVVCETGDVIPADGDVIEGIASVDESAITGESAPVVRESGGDRCAVTGGYRYRGPIKAFDGMYVFADSCSSEIFFAKPDDEGAWTFNAWENDANGYGTYSGFGEDEAGNLYVANNATDEVFVFHDDPPAPHTVTPVAGEHGAIDPDVPQVVDDGSTVMFTVTAESGYVIDTVSGCDGTLDGDAYTTGAITADCEVDAMFVVDPLDEIFRGGFE